MALALQLPERGLQLLQTGGPGRHRDRPQTRLHRRRPHLERPRPGAKRDAVPGKLNQVVFRADEEGTYTGQSSTLSGQAYAAMRTEVEVVSPPAYQAFINHQKSEVQAAQERVVGLIQNGKCHEPRPRPELVVDGFPRRRPRWMELATSADHKDVGRILVAGSLGFLFLAPLELLLMRLQLAIPENTFLDPETFNRILSLYGATSIFFFAIPLALGPLPLPRAAADWRPRHRPAAARAARQLPLGRRGDSPLPRLPLDPLRGRGQPAGAPLRARLPHQQRGRRLDHRHRIGDARLRPDRDRPGDHAARQGRPGMAWRRPPTSPGRPSAPGRRLDRAGPAAPSRRR